MVTFFQKNPTGESYSGIKEKDFRLESFPFSGRKALWGTFYGKKFMR
jgi:hypothetical protein